MRALSRIVTRWAIFFAALLSAAASVGEDAPSASPRPGWEVFDSEEGRFRVRFPDAPRAEREERSTWLGRMRDARYSVDLPDAGYVVEYHDLPRAVGWIVPSRTILDRAVAGLVEDADGRDAATRELSHDGHPARRVTYEVESKPGWSEEALLFLVGNRLYVLIAGGAPPSLASLLATFELRSP